MAIALEFIDFIVPISTIEKKYPGGWQQCLNDHSHLLGGRVWYDDHLLRNGAMNPLDIEALANRWRNLGFEPTGEENGRRFWKDFCITEFELDGLTLPCDWLQVSEDGRSAYLKDTDPGKVIGRDFGSQNEP